MHAVLWIQIRIEVITWIRIRINFQMTSQNVYGIGAYLKTFSRF